VGLSAYQWLGMAARRGMGGMERAQDNPVSVELRCAAASIKSGTRLDRCEPGPSADATGEIDQPDGNLQEFGGTRNPTRRHQEPEPSIEHGSAAGLGYGKSSRRARGDQLVAEWIFCTSFADWNMAEWPRQCLSRASQFGSFHRRASVERLSGNNGPRNNGSRNNGPKHRSQRLPTESP